MSFSFSKETQKTTRVLFTKKSINIFARKSRAIRQPSQNSSNTLRNKCSVILRNAPRLRGKWELRAVFNQRRNSCKSFKVKQLKKPQHPEGLATQRSTEAQHNQTTHQWAASWRADYIQLFTHLPSPYRHNCP